MENKEKRIYTHEIAKRIKAYRMTKKISQEKMAELLGITFSNYVKMENAYQNLTVKNLVNISKELDVSLDALVFGATRTEGLNFDDFIRLSGFFDTDNIQALQRAFQNILDLKSANKHTPV